MSEIPFRQMISGLVRQSRPQFRSGKPPSYLQRRHIAAAATAVPQQGQSKAQTRWQAHTVATEEQFNRNAGRLDKLRSETEPRSFSSFLTDTYSRQHNYLRISVTERCNLRCVYCMPEEGIDLSPPEHLLTTPEIVYLASVFVNQGVDKIRLTGGEPTVRKDILELMHQIGQLRSNGLKELCITTNGISLHRKLDSMIDSGLTGVNLSLDTLDPFQFTLMTRRNGHEAVMKSINRILEMNKHGAGIKLKINCVVMRGLNEREILPFIEMGKEQDLEVRFIEYMPFDGNKWSEKKMLSFQEMLALIRQRYPDVQKIQDHANDTSKTYKVPGFVGRIGFITSMTHNFCGSCNRLRITGDGNLKVCLFGNSEVSLRDILRESNDGKPIDENAIEAVKQLEMGRRQHLPGSTGTLGVSQRESRLLDVIGMAVKRKKEKHAGMGELENMKNRPMILIDKSVLQAESAQRPASIPRRPSLLYTDAPLYLLKGQFPLHSQKRFKSYNSTRSYSVRKTEPNDIPWRSIPSSSPDNIPAFRYNDLTETQIHKGSAEKSTEWEGPRAIYEAVGSIVKLRTISSKPRYRYITTFAESSRSSISAKPTTDHEGSQTEQPATPSISRSIDLQSDGSDQSKDSETPIESVEVKYVPSAQTYTSPRSQNQDIPSLSHLNEQGEAHMVSIADKAPTRRLATATATVLFSQALTYSALQAARLRKGDALAVTRIAGIQAAKKTADLIPLAHPALNITGVQVQVRAFPGRLSRRKPEGTSATDTTEVKNDSDPQWETKYGGVDITATVSCEGKTGVEMEALTSATVAGLTMYDMLKGIDKGMTITNTRVIAKQGGKSGNWVWDYQQERSVEEKFETKDNMLEQQAKQWRRRAEQEKAWHMQRKANHAMEWKRGGSNKFHMPADGDDDDSDMSKQQERHGRADATDLQAVRAQRFDEWERR